MPISLVDPWGRSLSFHFFNQTTESNFFDTSAPHSQGLLWSSIRYTQNFQNRAMPIPIVVATSRISQADQLSGNSSTVIPLANTQFEFTPFTFGSYDHTLLAQIPLTLTVSCTRCDDSSTTSTAMGGQASMGGLSANLSSALTISLSQGTFLTNGTPANSSSCVNYFDNAG